MTKRWSTKVTVKRASKGSAGSGRRKLLATEKMPMSVMRARPVRVALRR